MEYMRGYPDPSGVILYLYRSLPRIDLSLIGLKETNLQKGPISDLGLFSVEAVAERYRNGMYNVRMSDSNRPDGQREVIKTCIYKITDAGPAVYDIRTLELANAENIDEVNRQIAAGVLVRDTNGAPRLRTSADGGPVNPHVMVAAMGAQSSPPLVGNDLVSKVLGNLIDRAAASPGETVRQSIEIARMLTPPVAPIDVEGAVERALARLNLHPAAGGTLESELATYDRIDKLVRRFRGAGDDAGDGAAADAAGWAPHVTSILSEVRVLIPQVLAAWQQFGGGRSAAPAAAPAPAAVPATPAAAGVPVVAPSLPQRIEEIFAVGFDQMKKGTAGFDYAAWVCIHYPGGLEVYRHLETNGTLGVMALLAMHPAGRALTVDAAERAKLEKWLDDFFTFDPDGIGADPLPAEGAAPAAGANSAAVGH